MAVNVTLGGGGGLFEFLTGSKNLSEFRNRQKEQEKILDQQRRLGALVGAAYAPEPEVKITQAGLANNGLAPPPMLAPDTPLDTSMLPNAIAYQPRSGARVAGDNRISPNQQVAKLDFMREYAKLDPTSALAQIKEKYMPPPPQTEVINDQLVNVDNARVIGDYRTPVNNPIGLVYDANSPTGVSYGAKTPGTPGPPSSGLSLTTDGQGGVTLTQGRGVGTAGVNAVTNSTASQIEQDIIGGDELLVRLESIQNAFSPDFLTYGGAGEAKFANVLNKMDPSRKSEFAAARSEWVADNKQFFNNYRKNITGVAAGEREMADIEASIPNVSDSPQEYQRKMSKLVQMTRLMMARKQIAMRDGVLDGEFSAWAQRLPLGKVREKVNERGAQLEAEGMSYMQITATLKEEFGL
jgi:hypothetical protein